MTWKKIISIESLKLLRIGNYVLLSLLLLLYIGQSAMIFYLYTVDEVDFSMADLGNELNSMGTYFIGLFIAFFVMLNVGKEFSEGTLRKNVIDGYSRDHFFIGKLLMLLIVAIVAFVLGKIILLLGGLAVGNVQDTISLFTPPFIINPFVEILYSGMFALCLVFLTRNTTISIIVYIVWGTIESLIISLHQLFEWLNIGLEKFMPLRSIDMALSTTETIGFQSIIVTTFYIIVMLLLPYYIFLKRDLK